MDKKYSINGTEILLKDYKLENDRMTFSLNGKGYSFSLISKESNDLILSNGTHFHAAVSSLNKDGESIVMAQGREAIVSASGKKMKKATAHAGGLTSPMPGKIFKILKEVGSEVKKGEPVLILEAMKMEHSIRSDKDGKVKSLPYKVGELVQGGVILAEVD